MRTSSAVGNMTHCPKSTYQTVELQTCVFCELVASKRPISVICETSEVLAFMDIQPVNPGHVLVIPKRHAPYLADLDPTLTGCALLRPSESVAFVVRA